jgi:hypothetical protein
VLHPQLRLKAKAREPRSDYEGLGELVPQDEHREIANRFEDKQMWDHLKSLGSPPDAYVVVGNNLEYIPEVVVAGFGTVVVDAVAAAFVAVTDAEVIGMHIDLWSAPSDADHD